MTARNGQLHFGTRWSRKQARQTIAAAFRHAVRSARLSQAQVAKACGRSVRTVRYWLAGEEPVQLESIALSPRLRRHFVRCFAAVDRLHGGSK